jgi:hypothetical protein
LLGTGTEDLLTFLVGLGVSSNSRSLAFSVSSGSFIAFLSLIAQRYLLFSYAKNVHNSVHMVTECSTQTVMDLEELTEEDEEEEE